ncbi:hypothetical protein ACGFIY_21595 [Micromonospora chersina]|uniref:hypothetical protein n=1 Tax=Micromonospora chersina TaxID=47854 RepID=UPI0037163DD8
MEEPTAGNGVLVAVRAVAPGGEDEPGHVDRLLASGRLGSWGADAGERLGDDVAEVAFLVDLPPPAVPAGAVLGLDVGNDPGCFVGRGAVLDDEAVREVLGFDLRKILGSLSILGPGEQVTRRMRARE